MFEIALSELKEAGLEAGDLASSVDSATNTVTGASHFCLWLSLYYIMRIVFSVPHPSNRLLCSKYKIRQHLGRQGPAWCGGSEFGSRTRLSGPHLLLALCMGLVASPLCAFTLICRTGVMTAPVHWIVVRIHVPGTLRGTTSWRRVGTKWRLGSFLPLFPKP